MLTSASSALTPSLSSNVVPSASDRKSVLQGVEQAQPLTLSWRPCCAAAWRILSASGGVKLSTTPPFWPAACVTFSATEFASWIGTASVRLTVGTPSCLASARKPPSMYSVPGTLDWISTSLSTSWRIRYCAAPVTLCRGPMLTAE